MSHSMILQLLSGSCEAQSASRMVAHTKVRVLYCMGETAKSERVLDKYLASSGALNP